MMVVYVQGIMHLHSTSGDGLSCAITPTNGSMYVMHVHNAMFAATSRDFKETVGVTVMLIFVSGDLQH
jgi:hypothetical protein